MAKSRDNTRLLHAHGGPVTAAIRAMRDPVTPWLAPVEAGDPMMAGFHLGRRRDWADNGRSELVFLSVTDVDGEDRYAIWRCGAGTYENPADWLFTMRVGGIRTLGNDLLDLRATRH